MNNPFISTPELGMSEQRYHVAMLRRGEYILTPGELSVEDAKKKASYLSQYGVAGIVSAQEFREANVEVTFV